MLNIEKKAAVFFFLYLRAAFLMKGKYRIRTLLVLAICLISSIMPANAQATGAVVDGIVAVIGKEIIMQSDLEKHYLDYTAQFHPAESEADVKCTLLENLVLNKLMVHQAGIDSITVTDEELDYRVNMRMSYFLQSVGGDPKVIENFYHKPFEDIKKDMRELMHDQALIEKVQAGITENITVTPSEVKKFAEHIRSDSMPLIPTSYRFGDIVRIPPVSDGEVNAVIARLNGYRERVLRGDKFAMLARLYSDDPGSASKGGDLGFVDRGTLYPEFEAAAFNLKSGELSQVVKTQAGYHIIQMIERRGESIHVAHILIRPKPSADEQVKAIGYLDSVRKVIIDGKLTLEEASKRFSDAPNKNNGGMVVNPYSGSYDFDRQSLDEATFAVLDKLIPGEYSEAFPFVNEDGVMAYRLICLTRKVSEHRANIAEDYDLVKNAALEEKKYDAIQKWAVDKAKVTSIKINEQYRECPFVQKWQIP